MDVASEEISLHVPPPDDQRPYDNIDEISQTHRRFLPVALETQNYDISRKKFLMRILVGFLLLSCILFVVVDFRGERKIETALEEFLDWTHEHPYQGMLAVIVCYIFATILFVPGSILAFGAGFSIGSSMENTVVGILLASAAVFIGAAIGSLLSFLLGRYLFRNCVLQLAFSYPIFQAIERALESNGLKIMILLRLSPLIPYNALDYISGVTSISIRSYALALFGMLPGTIMICFIGASASSLSDRTSSTSASAVKITTIVTGVLFGGFGIFLVSYYSKLELDRILATQSPTHNATASYGDDLPSNEPHDIVVDSGSNEDEYSTELI